MSPLKNFRSMRRGAPHPAWRIESRTSNKNPPAGFVIFWCITNRNGRHLSYPIYSIE